MAVRRKETGREGEQVRVQRYIKRMQEVILT